MAGLGQHRRRGVVVEAAGRASAVSTRPPGPSKRGAVRAGCTIAAKASAAARSRAGIGMAAAAEHRWYPDPSRRSWCIPASVAIGASDGDEARIRSE